MPTEAAFYRQLRAAAKKERPDLTFDRIENWIGQGIPDLLICDRKGLYHFVELKFCRANAVNLRPHQISWLTRHRHSSAWILIKQKRDKIHLYHACQAIHLKANGLKLCPQYKCSFPFDWDKIFRLICPI